MLKHGMHGSKIHSVWGSMKSRCSNKNDHKYRIYGGKGISVCDEWSKFVPFMNWAFANGYEEGLSIERKDPNGNYDPDNCVFLTRKANSVIARRLMSHEQARVVKRLKGRVPGVWLVNKLSVAHHVIYDCWNGRTYNDRIVL